MFGITIARSSKFLTEMVFVHSAPKVVEKEDSVILITFFIAKNLIPFLKIFFKISFNIMIIKMLLSVYLK